MRYVAAAFAVAFVLFAAWGVVWWLRGRRIGLGPQSPGLDVASTGDEVPQVPVLRRGVDEARRLLDEIAEPADAVIAAWLALEDAAAASGVARRPAQTPTEFTVAVLGRTSADPDAAHELLGAYHRARFSSRPVTVADVESATRCLVRLAASWDSLPANAVPS